MTNCNCKTNCSCKNTGEPCRYEGPAIDCVGIASGDSLETIIRKITDYICAIPQTESLDEVICGDDIVIPQGTLLEESIPLIVSYFCSISGAIDLNITCGGDIVVPTGTTVENALVLIVQYFCSAIANTGQSIIIGGDNINVNSITIGSTTTYTISQPSKVFFYEEFISDIDIVPGAPLPGPDNYFFPIGYEILTFQNTYLNPTTFKVHVSYNTDIPSIVGLPTNALENWVDGAIVTTVGVADTVQYETLGVTDMEIYLWDTDSNNIISGVTLDTVRTTPADHPVDVRFTNNKKPKNTAFFKVVTLQPGEFVSLKFKSKAGSAGRLLKAQILVEEL